MFYRVILFLFLFAGTTVVTCAQESAQPSSKPVARLVAKINCDFSEYAPLRLSRLPSNSVEIKVEPVYPKLAYDSNIEGEVVIKILVNRQGKVVETCVERGDPMLVSAAVDASKKWRFKKHFGFSANSFKNRKYLQTSIAFTFRIKEETDNRQQN